MTSVTVIVLVYYLCFMNKVSTVIVPQDPECSKPLGLESKKILDNAIFAPPSAVASGKEGYYARLNNKLAWCIPNSPNSKDSVFKDDVYITIDLIDEYQITAISLQGYKLYSVGPMIRISYEILDHGFFEYKTKNDESDIHVQQSVNDDYQYLILDGSIFTRKIKVYLLTDANIKCLRMELYGCNTTAFKEYAGCPNKSNPVLTEEFNNISLFTSSAYLSERNTYNGLGLLFSKKIAWCIKADKINEDKFGEYTTINLINEYLLYGLQVDGYRENNKLYLASYFKLDYSYDGEVWANFYGGMKFLSSQYQSKTLEIQIPLIAKFLRIRMSEEFENITCIKLQVYGCQAILAKDVITPTLISSTNTNTTTTLLPFQNKVRIQYYKMKQGSTYQGIQFKDDKYDGYVVNNELDKGTGCLVDGLKPMTNPFSYPTCWLGWHKNVEPKPFIYITLTRSSFVNGIRLNTYINQSAKASPIKRFSLTSNIHYEMLKNPLYACTPDFIYALKSQEFEFVLDIGLLELQYLRLEMDYSEDWIFVRQIELIWDALPSTSIKMISTVVECVVPTKTPVGIESSSSNNIVMIIIVLMVILLIFLTVCVLYRCRKNLRHVIWKTPKSKPIVVRAKYGRDEVSFHGREDSSRSTLGLLHNNDLNCNEDVYAAPDKPVKSGYTEVNVQYAQYSAPDEGTKDGTIHYADAKRYAEPNSVPPTIVSNAIYQTSAIYASTYENPYKAVIASSLYSDPAKWTKQKASIKIFPRSQLTFKERIGVGQFGEVHIAVAKGLDEIYGTIGHYNSWGLTDTALVAVKMLKSKDENITSEFMKEVEIMSRLKHENVVRLLGICNYDTSSASSDKLMVVEYMENGDLNQYLRERHPVSADSVRISQISPDSLLPDQLLHIAEQIAAGVKYLHSEGFVHRDLATRNCLVGPALQVKISDFGMSRYLYSKQYYRIEGKAVLPIRWMAPESLFYGKFTQETDVWSFGVTLWEILTFARQSPYENLSDQQVISKACEAVQNPNSLFPLLSKPSYCQPEVYAVICKCWDMNPENRPTFTFLHRFFKEIVNSVELAV
ncbi:discoidin domain-containing receptor 2 isoform X1 [Hydra vulgaris]|uniref:discoidin domain-containing receptor 2 isoform X1 n=1 Tax=Hydra vulgaris TaxID=6087 RepID=UPI001F5FD161|nr:discoidin domain-containing receptor 2 isoform X1 [Hydra vulgaris]